MTTKMSAPSWSDAKAKLAAFDRAGLLGLVQDLYAASKDNLDFRSNCDHWWRSASRLVAHRYVADRFEWSGALDGVLCCDVSAVYISGLRVNQARRVCVLLPCDNDARMRRIECTSHHRRSQPVR